MKIWVDAQLSPLLARFLDSRFSVEARHVRELHLVGASDPEIFEAARLAEATVLTKDRDFVDLVLRRGCPPHIIWITCGNTSNREMMRLLESTFERACAMLVVGEPIIEIKG
jgi:predicted nuclease of predicted toxin-antitoxin system